MELVLRGGPIFTIDERDNIANAMSVRDGRVVAVGDESDVMRDLHPQARVIDLDGMAVLPGFVDTHTHWELTAKTTRLWINATTMSRDGMMDQIRSTATSASEGDWIVVQGTFWGPLPLRAELDLIAPKVPVVVRRTMHTLGANSLAMERAGLLDSGSVPKVGARVELSSDGQPTGLVEEGFDLFPIPDPLLGDLEDAFEASGSAIFARHGVTTIHDMPASTLGVRALQSLVDQDRMPVRSRLHYILPPVHQSTVTLSALVATGLRRGFGGPWLRIGGVKLFVDGYERASGWSHSMVGESAREPLYPRTFESLVLDLRTAFDSGIQVMMHAWGDQAQDMALDAVAAALEGRRDGLDHRTRIEHMGNHGYDPALLDRAVDCGVIPVPQASFLSGETPREAPYPRYVFRSALSAGIRLPYSSDCSGARAALANPWVGIAAMVDRVSLAGERITPDEAISLNDALRVCTINSAAAGFEEQIKGSLEVGKLADLCIVDADPRELAPADLATVDTVATHVGDRFTFSALDGVYSGRWA